MLLVKNIAKIVGVDESGRLRVKGRDMNVLGEIDNAWLLADGDRIAAYGTMDKMPEVAPDTEVVDAEGGMLFPSFCDSHTHLVYAGSREQEFLDKINGLSYEEIAKRGGGILNSADRLHETSEDELYEQAMERIREIIAMGTGCVEIKSGYGLTTEDELKMLRVIRRIRETSPITVRATFLGAHAVGRAYKGRQQEYVDLICREMIPSAGRSLPSSSMSSATRGSSPSKRRSRSCVRVPSTVSCRRSMPTSWPFRAVCRSVSATRRCPSIIWSAWGPRRLKCCVRPVRCRRCCRVPLSSWRCRILLHGQ